MFRFMYVLTTAIILLLVNPPLANAAYIGTKTFQYPTELGVFDVRAFTLKKVYVCTLTDGNTVEMHYYEHRQQSLYLRIVNYEYRGFHFAYVSGTPGRPIVFYTRAVIPDAAWTKTNAPLLITLPGPQSRRSCTPIDLTSELQTKRVQKRA